MRSESELLPAIAPLPPHLYPPAGAQSKNVVAYEPIGAEGTTTTILEVLVPPSMKFVVNQIGNNFVGGGFTEGSGQLSYQILDNAVPIEDFDDIPGSLGNVAQPSQIAPIIFEENHTVSFVVTNNAGSGIPADSAMVGATLRGWFYDRRFASEGEWSV